MHRLTHGGLLARNTLWNTFGQGAPFLVAILAIPALTKGLGVERFGVLTIVWVLIGYLNLFDFGLGRALTQLIAEKLGQEQTEEIPSLIWTSIFLSLLIGMGGALILAWFAPWLVHRVLQLPFDLQEETLLSLYLVCILTPVVVLTAAAKGVLAAHQRFAPMSAVNACFGVFTFIGPLAGLYFSQDLRLVTAILASGRVIALLAYLQLCLQVVPQLRGGRLKRSLIPPLMRFGGWMTVSNIVSPVMVYLDRFLIGALVSAAAVAYYATPAEVVTRMLLIPGALLGVMFPAFASSGVQEGGHTALLFCKALKYIFLAVFPLTVLMVACAHDGLGVWLGPDFANNSTLVLQLLSVGVFVNCLSLVPYTLIQGVGRPDISAKFHIMELPIYILLLWKCTSVYGIAGAALACLLRITADAVLLFCAAWRLLPKQKLPQILPGMLKITFILIAVILSTNIPSGTIRIVAASVIIIIYILIAWTYFLDDRERKLVRNISNRSPSFIC